MPRVKEVRKTDTNLSKDVTTRSKTKIKSKVELSSPPALKKRKTRAVPQTKSMAPKKQYKKEDTDEDECNENLTQNKSNKNTAKNHINKEKINVKKEKVDQKPNQNKRIIILDDSSKDSVDDNEYESEDDYEPDTSDEEEYRSRSYFW